MEILQCYRYCQHVNEPTHQNGHRVDLVITRGQTDVFDTEVSYLISDHHIVYFCVNVHKPPFAREEIVYKWVEMNSFASDITSPELFTSPEQLLDCIVDQYNANDVYTKRSLV